MIRTIWNFLVVIFISVPLAYWCLGQWAGIVKSFPSFRAWRERLRKRRESKSVIPKENATIPPMPSDAH